MTMLDRLNQDVEVTVNVLPRRAHFSSALAIRGRIAISGRIESNPRIW
ncbi:MAG: hypothetical protein L0Y57_05505 [Beijerinckiaceae bacterium]|nr:hypothetical protein [Beijerinckiaceae bacterium]